jgi:hypothetical protein
MKAYSINTILLTNLAKKKIIDIRINTKKIVSEF